MYHLRVRIFPDVHIQSSAMVLIEAYERAINSIHKIENASRVHTEFDGDIVFISAPLSTDHVRVFAISFVHVKYVCMYICIPMRGRFPFRQKCGQQYILDVLGYINDVSQS